MPVSWGYRSGIGGAACRYPCHLYHVVLSTSETECRLVKRGCQLRQPLHNQYSLLLGQSPAHLIFLILNGIAGHIHQHAFDGAGEPEGRFVGSLFDAIAIIRADSLAFSREDQRYRDVHIDYTHLLTIDEQLAGARGTLAILDIGVTGDFELVGDNNIAFWHFPVRSDLEVLA